jgi:hypothetical protein
MKTLKYNKFNEDKVNLEAFTTIKSGYYNSISWLNKNILEYISSIYKEYGYLYQSGDVDINVDGYILNTEYINKMVNNYTIFKSVISYNSISNESEFYKFMLENMSSIYHWKSDFFISNTLPILINTTRKGNIGEKDSLNFFKNELLLKKNIHIDFIKPTISEDISGIDGKFNWNGKEITIQVKPYKEIDNLDGKIKVFSQGSLSLNTDYLILYKQYSFIVVKGKYVKIEGSYFKFDEDKVVASILG